MVVGGMLEGVVELESVWRCLFVLEWRSKWKKKKRKWWRRWRRESLSEARPVLLAVGRSTFSHAHPNELKRK